MNQSRFFPNGDQASNIDLKMRRLLGDSIWHITEQASGAFEFDRAGLSLLTEGLMKGRPFPPSTFALYAELVMAIQVGDHSEAANLMEKLGNERPLPERREAEVIVFGEEENQARDALYQRFMDTDPTARFGMIRPSAESAAVFRKRLQAAFLLILQALPELADEFDRLITQIILVAPEQDAEYRFDGGSSYMLWGGLFLNALSHENRVALVEVLAHESAHMLLFGFSSDEPLVLNSDEELYPSPLRYDPRPMDGIYHSTYVSARMHWAMSRLLDSGLLDREEAAFARSARETDRENFYSGYSVVAEFAVLTDTGRSVMQSAKEYMHDACK